MSSKEISKFRAIIDQFSIEVASDIESTTTSLLTESVESEELLNETSDFSFLKSLNGPKKKSGKKK